MRSDSSYSSECEAFTAGDVRHVRGLVAGAGRRAGLGPVATDDLVTAVSEVVVNAVVYAGGHGSITIAQSPDGLRVEVRDDGPGLPAGVTPHRLSWRSSVSSSARGVIVRMFVPMGTARA